MPAATLSSIAHEARRLVERGIVDPAVWDVTLRQAAKLLCDALAEHPSEAVLLTCWAAVLSDQGHHRKAVAVLREVIKVPGLNDANAFFNLGVAMMNCNDLRPKAMPYFDKAGMLESHPDTWRAYFDAHGT